MVQSEEKKKNPLAADRPVYKKTNAGSWAVLIIILVLAFVWGVVGFIAFVYSIVCFGRSGTTGQHILGLVLAILFGPFYFIYYGVSKSYCNTTPPSIINITAPLPMPNIRRLQTNNVRRNNTRSYTPPS